MTLALLPWCSKPSDAISGKGGMPLGGRNRSSDDILMSRIIKNYISRITVITRDLGKQQERTSAHTNMKRHELVQKTCPCITHAWQPTRFLGTLHRIPCLCHPGLLIIGWVILMQTVAVNSEWLCIQVSEGRGVGGSKLVFYFCYSKRTASHKTWHAHRVTVSSSGLIIHWKQSL